MEPNIPSLRVLLPGGATWFNQTKGYAEAGKHIYEIVKEMNDQGIHMPIWGTCLGFELLLYISAGNREYRANCQSMSQALSLEFAEGIEVNPIDNISQPITLNRF